ARATLPWLSRRDRAIGGCRPARWEKHCHRRRCHGAIKDSHHSAFRSALTCRLPPYRVATCRRTDRESPTRRAALIAPREALKSKCCGCLEEFPAPHRHPGGVRATPCLENPHIPVVLTVRLPALEHGYNECRTPVTRCKPITNTRSETRRFRTGTAASGHRTQDGQRAVFIAVPGPRRADQRFR